MIMKDQYEIFCQEYVANRFNSTQAAISAGYAKASAYNQGHRLLKNPEVRKRVKELKLEVLELLQITRERVIKEFGRIGFSDIRKLYNEDRSLKDIQELDDSTAAAIESIEVVANTVNGTVVDYTHKIKLASKNVALKNLGQHFNIYEDHEKSGTGEMHVHIEGKDASL